MMEYCFPVNLLVTIGKPTKVFGAWDSYGPFRFGPDHVGDLLRMISDMDLHTGDSESREVWAPVHAWRALAELDPVAALEAMLAIEKAVHEETDSDLPCEDIISLATRIGSLAIPSLERFLADIAQGETRTLASQCLGKIGMQHPHLRDTCVAALLRALDRYLDNEDCVNGMIIWALADLKSTEAAPQIERAFAAKKVDESMVGDWSEVAYDLGLTDKKPTRKNPMFSLPAVSLPQLPTTNNERARLRAKRKAQRQAKRKNRRQRQ